MENTHLNKSNFFLFQYANNRDSIKHIQCDGVLFNILSIINNPEEYYAELTPLHLISDEDAIKVAKMYFDADWEIFNQNLGTAIKAFFDYERKDSAYLYNDLSFGGESHESDYFRKDKVVDFLSSKGYALPYNGLSVEEQVQRGWVQLRTEI